MKASTTSTPSSPITNPAFEPALCSGPSIAAYTPGPTCLSTNGKAGGGVWAEAAPPNAIAATAPTHRFMTTPPTSGRQPQRCDRCNNGKDQQQPHGARRLVEPEDADGDRSDRADPAPHRIGRAHRDRSRGDLEQPHADGH